MSFPIDTAEGILAALEYRKERQHIVNSEWRSNMDRKLVDDPETDEPAMEIESEAQAIVHYMEGVRRPEFDMAQHDLLKAAAEEVGMPFQSVRPEGKYPIRYFAAIKDETRPAYGGYDAYAIYFFPSGGVMGIHGRGLHIRPWADPRAHSDAHIQRFIGRFQAAFIRQQAQEAEALKELNERRAERNLPPFEQDVRYHRANPLTPVVFP
jgi:hypothetical protein